MRLLGAIAALGWLLATAATALAIPAPIHISGTAGEGVFIRSGPSTGNSRVGWMPEGASPDYNCFAWGQNVNGVPIWFNVNYNGVTGYYASFYDDSSYRSNEELTAKYGVPLCGSAPPAAAPVPQAPAPPPAGASPPAPPSTGASPPRPAAVYFNPYPRDHRDGPHLVDDGATLDLPHGGQKDWYGGCRTSRRPYDVATSVAGDRPIVTLSGWSLGRIGILSFLANATVAELKQVNYVLLIDPGKLAREGMKCDLESGGGDPYVRWLHVNEAAHLVIISGALSQNENSRGIQEAYFNDMRDGPYPEVTSRVLVCNYPIDHKPAFWSSRYWIQHQIGSTRSACPRLLVDGRWIDESVGWHPINN
jgi:uncharacterized protein YraI